MKINKDKKVKISTVAYSVTLIVIGLFVLMGVIIYGFGINNGLTRKVAQIFPYPAGVIDGVHFITINNLEKNVQAVKKFYESQDFSNIGLSVDFTTADGEKRLKIKEKEVLTKMIENRVIEILANQKGIRLTKKDAAQEVQKRMTSDKNQQDFADSLQKLYGWNQDDFETRIVKPDLYKEKLAENIRQNEKNSVNAKNKIEQALTELQAKKDFGEVAKKYSEGESAKNGGELGWFSADQMLPEIALAVYSLKKGETSEVIESSLGYHIIQVENKKTENGNDKLQLKQIFARTTNFADWLLEQEKNMKIHIPIKGLYWDKNNGRVEFNDNDLKKFEENLNQNSPNDASVLF